MDRAEALALLARRRGGPPGDDDAAGAPLLRTLHASSSTARSLSRGAGGREVGAIGRAGGRRRRGDRRHGAELLLRSRARLPGDDALSQRAGARRGRDGRGARDKARVLQALMASISPRGTCPSTPTTRASTSSTASRSTPSGSAACRSTLDGKPSSRRTARPRSARRCPRAAVGARPRRRSARHRAHPRRQPRHADAGVPALDRRCRSTLALRALRARRRRRARRSTLLAPEYWNDVPPAARASPAPSPARTAWVGARDGDGKLVACARAIATATSTPGSTTSSSRPQWRGCGLGQAVDAAAASTIRACAAPPRVLLQTRDAQPLYRKLGFIEEAEAPPRTVSAAPICCASRGEHGAHALHRQLLHQPLCLLRLRRARGEGRSLRAGRRCRCPTRRTSAASIATASMTGRVPAIDHDGFWLAESARDRQLPRRGVPGAAVSRARCPESVQERARARMMHATGSAPTSCRFAKSGRRT